MPAAKNIHGESLKSSEIVRNFECFGS